MGNQVGSLKVRTANKRQQRIPQTFGLTTTSDFFKPSVVFCKKVMPGEHCKIRTTCNIKPRAMAMPSEIKLQHNLRAFWVPNFATHKDWFAYRTQTPFRTTGGSFIHDYDYYTYNSSLVKMFIQNPVLRVVGFVFDTNLNNLSSYDQVISIFSYDRQTLRGYCGFDFTLKGRLMLTLLEELGYELNWQITVNQTADIADPTDAWKSFLTWETDESGLSEIKLSMRPLLSLTKIMSDWYVPSQYQTGYNNSLQTLLESDGYIDMGQGLIGTYFSDLMLNVSYNPDRFNMAWKNPQGPNDNVVTFNKGDITTNNPHSIISNDGTQPGVSYGGAPQIVSGNDNTPNNNTNIRITDYILRALNAIQNYTTRNRIAGYRPIDRFLAHFGIHLDYVHTKRSQYITSNTVKMYSNDIISMTQGAGASPSPNMIDEKDLLGGKSSVMYGKNGIDFEWKADDDGWIIVIGTIIPDTGYFQGIKNHCIEAGWLDSLYNPEFDNLGTTGINSSELFHNRSEHSSWQPDNETWGYEPTYLAMKTGWDTLAGDFRIRTMNTGLDAMHTLRIMEPSEINGQQVSSAFLKGVQEQFDRIFDYTTDDVDHYVVVAETINSGTMPVESVAESLPITDGEGNQQKFEYGGSYMN